MKQKLLYFILSMLFTATFVTAQTKTWNFSSGWPEVNGFVGYPACDPPTNCAVQVDNLTIVPHTSTANMGEITSDAIDFGDGFVSTVRFETNGSAGGTTELPIRRYLKFPVGGNVDVKVWLKAQGTSSRIFYVSDGSTVLFQVTKDTDPTVEDIVTANYIGGATDLYIYGSNGFNLYKIEVTGPGAAVLGVNDFNSPVTTNIKAIGDRIYVSNVKTSTEISIYSITGALVKSFKTTTDTDFSFKTGLWIASVKTVEGQKAVKLVTQ